MIQANQDISTSDALQMSKKLDYEGERTLGVITKVDLMDSGTSALKVLQNEEIPLRYGYVGIKGRSQADIMGGVTIKKGLDAEERFFDTHPTYSNLTNKNKILGTRSLVYKMTLILNKSIKKNLPAIISEIREKITESETRLGMLGSNLPATSSDRMQLVWTMLNDYSKAYQNTIVGKYSKIKRDEEPTGAQLRMSFVRIFEEIYHGKDDLSSFLTDKDIEHAFMNYDGDSFPGSPSYDGF